MRKKRALRLGDVITIDLPSHISSGHEQTGIRPAIVVGIPTLLGKTLCFDFTSK
ncbi:hypothetical protein H8E77_07640 [bacterium]|nr:hypothetical protein [bacterium]